MISTHCEHRQHSPPMSVPCTECAARVSSNNPPKDFNNVSSTDYRYEQHSPPMSVPCTMLPGSVQITHQRFPTTSAPLTTATSSIHHQRQYHLQNALPGSVQITYRRFPTTSAPLTTATSSITKNVSTMHHRRQLQASSTSAATSIFYSSVCVFPSLPSFQLHIISLSLSPLLSLSPPWYDLRG